MGIAFLNLYQVTGESAWLEKSKQAAYFIQGKFSHRIEGKEAGYVTWWDKSEGNLPNPDVQYPSLAKLAAFACKEGRCSFPVTNPADLKAKVDQLYR